MLSFLPVKRLSKGPSGRSLIEVLLVIGIIGVLAALAFPLATLFKAKAEYAGCVSNLKALHAGFASYLEDHAMVWPQVPEDMSRQSGQEGSPLAKFWYEQLKDHGIPKKSWLCPGDDDRKDVMESETVYGSTYLVTEFDDQPNRAYQWATQPWLVEKGDLHGVGKGPNVLFPDGHIERGIPLMMGK